MSITKQKRKKNSLSVENLQAQIRRPGIPRFQGIHRFRSSFPIADYFPAYRKLFPTRAALKDYFGNPFPRTASQIFSNAAPKIATSAVREIAWSIARCQQFSSDLSSFLQLRHAFELATLRNEHGSAKDLIDAIEAEYGKSVWLYQNRIALAYISSDEAEPGDVAKSVIEETKDSVILGPLIYYIRKRIESATLRPELEQTLTLNIQSELHLEYFRKRILNLTDSSDSAASASLFLDSQASVIDHYDSLIFSLQAAVSDYKFDENSILSLLPSLTLLQKSTGDDRLLGVLLAMGGGTRKIPESDRVRARAIELYTMANYAECATLSGTILDEFPDDSAIRILLAKARVETGLKINPDKTLIGEIDGYLLDILGVTEQFFSSIQALLVLADRFSDHAWMVHLRLAILSEIVPEEGAPVHMWLKDAYVRDRHITPFIAFTLPDADAASLLKSEGLAAIYPETLRLVEDSLKATAQPELASNSRAARYRARRELALGNYPEARTLYEIAASSDSRVSVTLRSLGGASVSLMLQGEHSQAVDKLVNAYLKNPRAPTLLPFKKIVELLPDASEWPNTIRLCILLNLHSEFETNEDLSRQRLAFENFCIENDINSPKDLVEQVDRFGVDAVIEFLSNVWRPEIMRQTLLYSEAEKIEEARIDCCRELAKLDSDRTRHHLEELASRIKQQEISKATALVEQSRVYVDIDAIKRSLRTRLGTSYARYKGSLTQHEKPQDMLVRHFQDMLPDLDSSTSLSAILSKIHILDDDSTPTQADLQFNTLFSEIAKEFLSGGHGLNAYLSTRVRHGKLVDAMRKAVMDEHLVTSRSAEGVYADHTYWLQESDTQASSGLIARALEKFSQKFDKILFDLRDRYIQVVQIGDLHGFEKKDDRLFVYLFSSLERRLMQTYDTNFNEFDQLITKCVNTLWEKTDANLAKVRAHLNTSTRASIISEFDDLATSLSEIYPFQIPSSLGNAVARARTATQQALESVIGWFRRNEVYDRKDFEIDLAPQIAANMVNRTMSSAADWECPPCSLLKVDSKLPGRSLDGLVDIFYEVFENALKYADRKGIDAAVRVALSYEGGQFDCEIVSQGLPPTVEELERLQQIRESLKTPEYRQLAQSEGKSGFTKIWLALDNPLYRAPALSFAHEDAGDFRVIIQFKMNLPT